ncbi:MAG: GNAT family N-acetyltransferase, partial [Chthonomonadales bacterium]|nr:GNAT family N-acetyltransferase [Chthonomonadales bacterium]
MDRDTNSESLRARQREIRDEEANLLLTPEPDGRSTRVELVVCARSVSRCWIVSQRIRIGAAVVRMDGIGGVGTDESERHKGYASRVLDAAMRRMLAGDAALTMLYGIPDFYRRFGYVPAGPEHFVRLSSADCALPSGWTSRPLRTADLPTVHSIYEAETSRAVGPAVRTAACYALRQLRAAAESPSASDGDVCRVVLDPDGDLGGYVWRGNGFWATEILERETPDSLIISEALAISAPAADAVLAVCRQWAHEVAARTGRPVTSALISAPHDGRMAAAARRTDAELVRRYVRCGGSMARILDLP